MGIFAALIVFMSASFGNVIGTIQDTRNLYNHNMFFVYTGNEEVSKKLNDAVGRENTGIDFVSLRVGTIQGSANLRFRIGNFETFDTTYYSGVYMVNAAYIDVDLAKDLKLLVGKKEGLKDTEIVISSKVADVLLEKSTLGYISKYEDILGMLSDGLVVDGKSMYVAGVVESNETAIYMTSVAIAKTCKISSYLNIALASDTGMEVSDGEAILLVRDSFSEKDIPAVGEVIKIGGKDIKIKERYVNVNYDQWLKDKGVEKQNEQEFFQSLHAKNVHYIRSLADQIHQSSSDPAPLRSA